MSPATVASWLFTRGAESVRLVRKEDESCCHLIVHGPGTDRAAHEFADVTECARRQTELEQRLWAEGYRLWQSDRRVEGGIWRGIDRRRAAH